MKILKRYLKDTGRYYSFVNKVMSFKKCDPYYAKRFYLKNPPIEDQVSFYSFLMGINEHSSDFQYYIKNKIIGEDKILKMFFDFLKKKKCLTLYLGYVNAKFLKQSLTLPELKTDEQDKTIILKTIAPPMYINYTFHWSSTPQGQEYWGKIHLEWRKIYYDFLNKELNTNEKV